MAAGAGGWWRLHAEAGDGDRYAYSLDGSEPLPDPRSASQPDGVASPSALVEHAGFHWHDDSWPGLDLQRAILYELHVGTFTRQGTFDAAAKRMPHLRELGIDAVEVMPVAEFPGERGWGYDGVDLFAPHHSYGGPDGLKRFVSSCHDAGIAVLLDVVYNHLGPDGNYLPRFGPYFSGEHETHWGSAVNLDGPGSHEVRRFLLDNALMWLRDYHIDGLRLDAVHAMVDNSAVHFLEELASEVGTLGARLGKSLVLIGESDLNDPRFVRPRHEDGYGLDACWADEWHHALHAALTGERSGYYEDFGSLEQLSKALLQAWVYDGIWSEHRQRVHGHRPDGLPGSAFVVSLQNHDQIGNRAQGERLGALVSRQRLAAAAALLMTSPFVPMLFQGEEWGATTPFQYFTDHSDPTLGRAVTTGRRHEFAAFGWEPDSVPDPQALSTYEDSRLDWSELDGGDHKSLLDWYKTLVGIRKRYSCLTDGRWDLAEASVDPDSRLLRWRRGDIVLWVNLGCSPVSEAVPDGGRLLAAYGDGSETDGAAVSIPPDGVVICALARRPS
jgi:maltooligosyltrehalose trehalohydrolase